MTKPIKFRLIDEVEAAEIACHYGHTGRLLLLERDFLRELVKAKDEYIACYKTGKRPSEALLDKLERLTAMLERKKPDAS